MRILVVDDDAVFREELAELLREEGHLVHSAPSVAKAVETLEREEITVVLTDLKMPRGGGLELLREIRTRWPRTMVVVVTGFASVETALEAMKLGAFDYVRKPFRLEQIRETLRLAHQEHEFEAPPGAERDPAREALALAESGKYEVLFVGAPPPKARPHLTVASAEGEDLASTVQLVESFVADHPNGALVLSGVERWLAQHRLEDVVGTLDRFREVLAGHGPLRVGFDPGEIGAAAANALSGAVVADETHFTLEALANPIRRRVLQRLSEGAAPFAELMRAAGLEESPKMSFHIRRLLDSRLLLHEGESYSLTSRGHATVRLLADITYFPAGGDGGNLAFPGASPPPVSPS